MNNNSNIEQRVQIIIDCTKNNKKEEDKINCSDKSLYYFILLNEQIIYILCLNFMILNLFDQILINQVCIFYKDNKLNMGNDPPEIFSPPTLNIGSLNFSGICLSPFEYHDMTVEKD